MKTKRLMAPKAKKGQLVDKWGKVDGGFPDLCYAWGEGCDRADGRLLHWALATERCHPDTEAPLGVEFTPSFTDELVKRGYDLTTIKFSIQKKLVN